MASEGYPGTYQSGRLITGIEDAEQQDATVFHAGTRKGPHGIETSGGRVLGVTASGEDLRDAIRKAYSAVNKVHFEGAHYRRDIGWRGLSRYNGEA
jgi:phosphoribosylamine--glycine ligase